MSRDRLAEAEWKADCLQSRMDALAKSRADAVGEEYTAIRKRAERRGLEATVTGDGVKVVVPKPDAPGRKYVTKTVRTMAELEALMGTRVDASKDQSIAALKAEMDRYSKLYDKTPNRDATNKNMYYKKFSEASTAYHKAVAARGDADDPCWEGYEQRGTKEKGGSTVPKCVKSDADVPKFVDWLASKGYQNYVVAPRMTEKLREKYAGNFTQAQFQKLKDEYRKINPTYF